MVRRNDTSFPAASVIVVTVPRPVPPARPGSLGVGNVHGARARRGGRLGRLRRRGRRASSAAARACGSRSPARAPRTRRAPPSPLQNVADGEMPPGSDGAPVQRAGVAPYLYSYTASGGQIISGAPSRHGFRWSPTTARWANPPHALRKGRRRERGCVDVDPVGAVPPRTPDAAPGAHAVPRDAGYTPCCRVGKEPRRFSMCAKLCGYV